ncbi:MAG: FHA domain-containing protein [Bifidobacteriaceae bacterium]|nr:FHA domain-containing protein [Bifidobacteriaceae bacterium]
MTDSEQTAGETTSIGIPAIQVPVTTSSMDRPLSQQDLLTIEKLEPGSALLVTTRGSSAGARYLLDEDVVTVGRDPESDILLDNTTVSRRHAIFKRHDGRYTVEDAGSLNGTYVNMKRVDSAELHNGDSIIIGKFRMLYFAR